ncbi:hypothetical protein C6568_03820 [Melaminivora suipulveris]|uniref:Uncharacterized protein n=1 Tax=Melaminivora suipulveris TaxID=2109913 RepID=A0A2R3Q9M0_9BURK|nr:hypothetical protein [Melaminivora suipulveris]AVO48485.1 hypothetical protein C6568_03820 [Melaminivora suipulveris]
MTPMEKARADAQAAAQRTLQRAATFTGLHATAKPLFQKPMRMGSHSYLVRFVWPGVLLVCDPATGEVLAQSVVGNPAELAAGFAPGTAYPGKPREAQ